MADTFLYMSQAIKTLSPIAYGFAVDDLLFYGTLLDEIRVVVPGDGFAYLDVHFYGNEAANQITIEMDDFISGGWTLLPPVEASEYPTGTVTTVDAENNAFVAQNDAALVSRSGDFTVGNLAAGATNTVVTHNVGLTLQTRTIDTRVWGTTLISNGGVALTEYYVPVATSANGLKDSIITNVMGMVGIGLGTTVPDTLLHVWGSTAGGVAAAANTLLTVERNGDAWISFLTPAANAGGINFGSPTSSQRGVVRYDHSTDVMSLCVGSTTEIFGVHTTGTFLADSIYAGYGNTFAAPDGRTWSDGTSRRDSWMSDDTGHTVATDGTQMYLDGILAASKLDFVIKNQEQGSAISLFSGTTEAFRITNLLSTHRVTANLETCVNAGVDTDQFLVRDATGNIDCRTGAEVLSDIGGAPAAHNLLSGTHTDTLTASVLDGDIIIGNVTPNWSRLAISVPAASVRNVLGIDNGELRPSWKTALDTTTPATIAVGGVGTPGTSLIFAHRDHNHPAPATWTATAHNLLSAIHGDSTTATCVRGDIITGQGVSPTWTKLAKGTTNYILKCDATDVVWNAMLGIPALTTPAGDRIMFYDDTAGVVTWMTVSTGLDISGTTLVLKNASVLTDNYVPYWDDGNGQLADSIIQRTSTGIGIGMTPATAALDIKANASLYNTSFVANASAKSWQQGVNAGGDLCFYDDGTLVHYMGDGVAGFFTRGLAKSSLHEIHCYSDTVGHYPGIFFNRFHNNTTTVNTPTVDTEVLFDISSTGADSANNGDFGCRIRGTQVGASGTKVPCKMEFSTSTATAFNVALTIDQQQCLGIAKTPETWDATVVALEIGALGALHATRAEADHSGTWLTNNLYYNTTWMRMYNEQCCAFALGDGAFAWSTGAAGTADADPSMSTKMTLTNAGLLGVGIAAGDTLLHVWKATAGTVDAATNAIITIENDTSAYYQCLVGDGYSGGIIVGSPDDNDEGMLSYTQSTKFWGFTAGGVAAFKIYADSVISAFPIYADTTKRVACGGGVTGTDTLASGTVTLEIDGVSKKLLYVA